MHPISIKHNTCRAVEILKLCTATDSIKLLLSRGAAAQSQYRRLSDVLAETNSPLASSTPKGRHAVPFLQCFTCTRYGDSSSHVDAISQREPLDKVSAKQSVPLTPSDIVTDSGMSLPLGNPLQSPNFDTSSAVLQRQMQSTSASKPPVMYPSDDQGLTQRPSSGSHDENEGHKIKSHPDAGKTMPDGSQVALSNVVLSETQSSPAQKPISLSHLHERSVDVEEHGFLTTPPQPEPPTILDQHTDVITIITDKGLGICLTGGVGHSDGPGIYIAKILDGLDVSNDGQLKVGDQILKVNGEPFCNIQLEKAKHLLTQMKTRAVASTTASNISYHIDTSPQPHSNAAVSCTLVVMDKKPNVITGNSPGAVNSSQSPSVIVDAMSHKRTRQTGFGNNEFRGIEFSSKAGEVSDESDVNSSMGTPVKPGSQPVESSSREHELQMKLALTEKALKASKKKEKDL
ncbi:hypothetical protein EMCRGX_G030337 [Ephydatia muelleri]